MVGLSLLAAATPTEPPLEPDQETARQWAVDELSSPEYTSEPTWWEQFLSWLNDGWNDFVEWLSRLIASTGAPAPSIDVLRVVLITAVVVIVVGLAVWLFVRGIRRQERAGRSHSVFEDDARTAEEMIAAARAAAGSGDFSLATVEAYRAVVRAGEEAGLVDDRPGVTADEAATSIGSAFLTLASGVRSAAGDFDAVRYGEQEATRAQFAHGEQTYEALLAALDPEPAR